MTEPANVAHVAPTIVQGRKIKIGSAFFLFQLSGVARYKDGTLAEDNVPVPFRIVDENDNIPVFAEIKPGIVTELSAAGEYIFLLSLKLFPHLESFTSLNVMQAVDIILG